MTLFYTFCIFANLTFVLKPREVTNPFPDLSNFPFDSEYAVFFFSILSRQRAFSIWKFCHNHQPCRSWPPYPHFRGGNQPWQSTLINPRSGTNRSWIRYITPRSRTSRKIIFHCPTIPRAKSLSVPKTKTRRPTPIELWNSGTLPHCRGRDDPVQHKEYRRASYIFRVRWLIYCRRVGGRYSNLG